MASEPPFDESPEPERLRNFIAEIEAEGFRRIGPREWEGPIRSSLVEAGHTDADRMTLDISAVMALPSAATSRPRHHVMACGSGEPLYLAG